MKQFSIRDLLFLVVIVALGLGWWLDKRPIPARFQIATVSVKDQGYVSVLDTASGQLWIKWVGNGGVPPNDPDLAPKIKP